jgi:hypothetical protein
MKFNHALSCLLLLSTLGALESACAVAPFDADTATDDAALRGLSSAEIIGTITPGQTTAPVAYTNAPLYRAYRFDGRVGDKVDAWVRSSNGDARAWLLDASFKNVVQADDSEGTTNAHLVKTLSKTGTFYIAFREKTQRAAVFTVSLAGTTPLPECDPEVDNCPPDSGGGGGGGGGTAAGDVNAQDRTLNVSSASWSSLAFGAEGLFNGFASFDFTVSSAFGRLYLGSTSYDVSTGTQHFDRIALPASASAYGTSSSGSMKLSNIVYHITEVHPEVLTEANLSGRFSGSEASLSTIVIAPNVPGNKLTFTASAKVYKNWTNGLGCGSVQFNSETLASGETRVLTVTAPLTIRIARSCFSSRLATPENGTYDGRAFISNLTFGAP